ncbi:MAG: regulatory protein RecX, partial [Oscillospiraceae bacterium]
QRAADYRKGKERALYLLGYRDHCRKDLVDKLSKNIDLEIAEKVADQMEELGFLDDQKYAEKLARYLMIIKSRGARRAIQDMMMKGVSRDVAADAISLVELPDNLLTDLIERKYLRYLGDEKGRNKVIAALARLGHNYYDIVDAIDEVENPKKES